MMKTLKKAISALLSCALLCGLAAVPAQAVESSRLVKIDLWNAVSNQASMGNVATDHNGQALYNPAANTLQIATNSVSVSGYQSAIVAAQYDTTGKGNFVDVKVLSTNTVDTGTKYDDTNHTVTYLSSFEITLPSYLTKTGVEFIPVKMSVPYTPMDVVVGTGYLDARLRIDWNRTASTNLAQIVPNNTMSSGSIANVVLRDSSTGITLNADTSKVRENTRFSASRAASGSKYQLAQTALAGVTSDFFLFELKLVDGAAEVNPYGAVEVIFPYSGNVSMYRINADGSKTVLRGTAGDNGYTIMTTKLGLFAVSGGTAINTESFPEGTSFSDVPDTYWAKNYINQAVSAGLFKGTSATTFSPDGKMTNAMVLVVLHRMAGAPAVTVPASLDNVPKGAWYETAAAWGYENGVIGGYKTFDPTAHVTREELATMIYRTHSLGSVPVAGADISGFTDVGQVSPWAKDAVAWANAVGVVGGTGTTTLSPASHATRAQVAAMLCRYLNDVK